MPQACLHDQNASSHKDRIARTSRHCGTQRYRRGPGWGEARRSFGAPGAGKTTLVPLHLLHQEWRGDGKIILLEPRRLAARAAAGRMAELLHEDVGQTVGYRMRLDNRVSSRTRIEVVTEGVFARMVLDDPELAGVSTVIFDEFHERSLDGDFGLALALDVQLGLRDDLRLLVMSATRCGTHQRVNG